MSYPKAIHHALNKITDRVNDLHHELNTLSVSRDGLIADHVGLCNSLRLLDSDYRRHRCKVIRAAARMIGEHDQQILELERELRELLDVQTEMLGVMEEEE
ncbi:hypothetical protein E8E13_003362 [Curvularia kusanoi]|uniref:Uncharacterized protein n=1 Tax=Curvularia kusanoi TaxID=90978 RepID=A0A9P4W297_CURKU|nr:hypothetical protein E8E13_003362 [Curvularia kusanoi]